MEEKKKEKTKEAEEKKTEEEEKPINPFLAETDARLKRQEDIIAAQKLENDRSEQLIARKQMGGTSEAGEGAPAKKKLSDGEYWSKVEKGEADPFKEDGF